MINIPELLTYGIKYGLLIAGSISISSLAVKYAYKLLATAFD